MVVKTFTLSFRLYRGRKMIGCIPKTVTSTEAVMVSINPLYVTVSASPTVFNNVGDEVIITTTVKSYSTNTITANISANVGDAWQGLTELLSPLLQVKGSPITILPGKSNTHSFTYVITKADLTRGCLYANVRANSTNTLLAAIRSNLGTVKVNAGIPISASINVPSFSYIGQTITLTYSIVSPINLSKVAFTTNLGRTSCTDGATFVAGVENRCVVNYTVIKDDFTNGSINFSFAFQGKDSSSVIGQGSTKLTIVPIDPFVLTKTVSSNTYDTVGQILTYGYSFTNNTADTVNAVKIVDDQMVGKSKDVCVIGNVKSLTTVSTACSSTYIVTQADIDAGSISIRAAANLNFLGLPESIGSVASSGLASAIQNPSIKLTGIADPILGSFYAVGDTLTYNFTVVNAGNVTLRNVAVSDSSITPALNARIGTLAPMQSSSVSLTYTITQKDVDSLGFTSRAKASGDVECTAA
jgi:hypothetical protein